MTTPQPRNSVAVLGMRAGAALAALLLAGLASLPLWKAQAAQEQKEREQRGNTGEKTGAAPTPVSAARAQPAHTVSSAVYTPPSRALAFDHATHAEKGIGCERCHAGASRSTSAADNLLPDADACRACHVLPGQPAAGTPRAGGGRPLSFMPTRPFLPLPALKLNHRLHVERGIGCALCHAGIDERKAAADPVNGVAGERHLPTMALCLGCHDGKQATSKCASCHPTLPDGRLKTSLAGGLLAPSGSLRGVDAHTSNFRRDHKVAGRDQRYCATCHKQNECLDCHGAGVVRPADFHPVDYASLHAQDAKRNMPNCSACHRNQTFCLGCHQRLGVSAEPEGGQAGRQPQNPFGTGTQIKHFHPPGWVRDASGTVITAPSPASHSVQARRNLRSCTSCHREDGCLDCHSADPTRSIQISPHPPGFAGSARCRALARNARACLKCHAVGSTALSCD